MMQTFEARAAARLIRDERITAMNGADIMFDELWDVAFHVMTLRADFRPADRGTDLGVSLADLARSSNDELLATLSIKSTPMPT